MSVVRPEFGPTLAELAGPRVQALPPLVRKGLQALAGAVVVLAAALLIHGSSGGLHDILVRKPIAFTLAHRSALHRVAPHDNEVLRLESAAPGPAQTFAVQTLDLGSYEGDVTARLMSIATDRLALLRKVDPRLLYRGEGKGRINFFPAYQLAFQSRAGGHLEFGRVFFIANATDDNPHPRDGVIVTMLAQHSKTIPNVAAVGTAGALKVPLRSFRFGTERP